MIPTRQAALMKLTVVELRSAFELLMNTFKTQVNSGDGMDISDKEDLHACSSYHLYITISKTAPINEENCVSKRKLTTLPWSDRGP